MSNAMVIITVMGLGGTIGGTINFVNGRKKGWFAWLKQILLSTTAALLVPLFLTLAKSDLLPTLLQAEKIWASSDVFVFLGFCLVAGIASDRFISSISDKILQEMKDTKEEVTSIKKEVREIQKQTEPLLEQLTEPEEKEFDQLARWQITDEEKSILKALVHPLYKLRSLSGIVADTNLPREQVASVLQNLKNKGLVVEVKRQGVRWMISKAGLRELDSEQQT